MYPAASNTYPTFVYHWIPARASLLQKLKKVQLPAFTFTLVMKESYITKYHGVI